MRDTTYRKRPDGGKRRKHLEEAALTGALAERRTADGRRKIKLNAEEKRLLNRSEMIERAVRLFLDLDGDHTWQEIAGELGVSIMALKDLTKTQEFIEVYDQHFAELGHDPRLRSAQAAIVDLLPLAVRELKELVSDKSVPPSVRFRAVEKILDLNGVGPQKGGQLDRHELMEFLRGANISITQNNLSTPLTSPYGDNIAAYTEGRWRDIKSHLPSAKAMTENESDEC